MNADTFIYRIDHADKIIDIQDPKRWCSFAETNGWVSTPQSGEVLGRKIWDFIQGHEAQHLYQEIFRRTRAGMHPRPLPFRCDSPGERRYLELRVKALPGDHIEFTSTILRKEPRIPVGFLDATVLRSSEFVTICSICKKIKINPKKWVEVEEGLVHFNFFEVEQIPGLSHGLCDACYHAAISKPRA